MKVAMVVPLSVESAIADVMLQAVPYLATSWDLEIWSPDSESLRDSPVPVHLYDEPTQLVAQRLERYDLVIHVLGDSALHADILPLALSVPGLLVMHDASLTNLVRHSAIERGYLDQLVDEIVAAGRPEAADMLRTGESPDGPLGWLATCAEFPLDAGVLQKSLGVVTHSRWHAGRIAGNTLGDVTVAPLPVPTAHVSSPDDAHPHELLVHLDPDEVLLVTVGTANANRHIDALLEAIASDPVLTARVRLWAVGPASRHQAAELAAVAERFGLADQFLTTGRVSDQDLHEILERADIAAALRDPVLEGQSASVLTQMLAGVPVIVYDHAHYSELPDDSVIKVDLQDGPEGLARALRVLVDDPVRRAERGRHAREHILEGRTAAAYAEAILEAGARALGTRAVLRATLDVAARLARLDLQLVDAVVSSAADTMFDLYDLA